MSNGDYLAKQTCLTILPDYYGYRDKLVWNFKNLQKGGMLVCCLVTGSVLVSIGEETNRTMSIVAVTFILIFVVFFQIGAGPIPPFITSDFFDASLR